MGAWGSGPFENDDALDFVFEIEGVDSLKAAFEGAKDDYIDAGVASEIVVAAECVAAMAGSAHPGMPEELAERLKDFPRPEADLLTQASEALAAVAKDSELVELWNEDGPNEDSDKFHAEMDGLAERLEQALGKAQG